MLIGSRVMRIILLGIVLLLTGCSATYESAQEKYNRGEVIKARKDWSSLARQGDTRSMYRLYQTGNRQNASDSAALKQAAVLGYAPAQYDFGLVLISQNQFVKAAEQIQRAAAGGDVNAKGWIETHDVELQKWPLAEEGDASAMVALGQYYASQKQFRDAYYWFDKAATANDPLGMYYMGVMYSFGYYVKEDDQMGAMWYRKAADLGEPAATYNLCTSYRDGKGIIKNAVKARKLCQRSSEQGYTPATIELGIMYLYGTGGDKNPQEAFSLLEPLGDESPYAAVHLGDIYYSGIGKDVDFNKAFDWYEKANSGKDTVFAFAARRMATIYEGGLGRPQNFDLALKYYLQAAQSGDSYSQRRIGVMYQVGKGVDKDMTQAAKWFEKAAKQGDATSAFYVGKAYLDGDGVNIDLSKAEQYLLQSAEAGDVDAQLTLGFEYASGKSFTQSYDKFALWTEKSAWQGNSVAQYNMSVAYENGWGKEKNYAWAAFWSAKSAQQDYLEAKEAFPSLLKHLSDVYVSKKTQVRASADKGSQPLMTMNKGAIAYVLSTDPIWTQVVLANYTTGYIPTSHLAKTEPVRSTASPKFPAKPEKVSGKVSCNTRCVNATCYRTYDDGRQIKFKAKQTFNSFTGQFEWDSGSC